MAATSRREMRELYDSLHPRMHVRGRDGVIFETSYSSYQGYLMAYGNADIYRPYSASPVLLLPSRPNVCPETNEQILENWTRVRNEIMAREDDPEDASLREIREVTEMLKMYPTERTERISSGIREEDEAEMLYGLISVANSYWIQEKEYRADMSDTRYAYRVFPHDRNCEKLIPDEVLTSRTLNGLEDALEEILEKYVPEGRLTDDGIVSRTFFDEYMSRECLRRGISRRELQTRIGDYKRFGIECISKLIHEFESSPLVQIIQEGQEIKDRVLEETGNMRRAYIKFQMHLYKKGFCLEDYFRRVNELKDGIKMVYDMDACKEDIIDEIKGLARTIGRYSFDSGLINRRKVAYIIPLSSFIWVGY